MEASLRAKGEVILRSITSLTLPIYLNMLQELREHC
jgi:hypothetical protein